MLIWSRNRSSLAVKSGRFVAVGSIQDVGNLVSSSTEVINAEGMTITPGFIDAHTHPEGVEELARVLGSRFWKQSAAQCASTSPSDVQGKSQAN